VQIDLTPGRYLVEITDDGARTISRIGEDERAHGGPGPDLHIPGVHAWLDGNHEAALRDLDELLAEDD
jgi:hypothetical protein